jgi:hypothetical protein
MTIDPKKIVVEEDPYDNFIGKKAEAPKKSSLAESLNIEEVNEDDEKMKIWNDLGMPEFDNPKNGAYKKLIINFRSKEAYEEFSRLIEQNLYDRTKSIWYPAVDRPSNRMLRWIED